MNRFIKKYLEVVFVCMAILSVVLWFAWWWFAPLLVNRPGSYDEAGQRGDMFGSINALFTCLAFCGLLYTIIMQRRELAEARQNSKNQEVTAMFFRQIEHFCVERARARSTVLTGYEGIGLVSHFVDVIEEKDLYRTQDSSEDDQVPLLNMAIHGGYISAYRSLLIVFKLIDSSGISDGNRDYLLDVLRAEISPIESRLLYYICTRKWGVELKQYSAKYAFLSAFPDASDVSVYYRFNDYEKWIHDHSNDISDKIRRHMRLG